jgi:glycosyltransferase involved in cell wall biosynthesis
MTTAVVVIPTRNEEKSIEGVIAEIRSAFEQSIYDRLEILITDDSSDATRAIARRLGVHVVNGGGEGLGAAMYRGLKEALAFEPDVIVSIDGDGQTDAKSEIPRFVGVIERDEADLVLGSRFKEEGLVRYRYRLINRLGTRLLTRLLNSKTGLGLTDSHGGIRAMRPAVVRELQMIGTHTYVQETIIDAAEKGFRIVELASAWRVREHGTSRVVGSIPKYVFYTLPIILLRSGHHVRTLYNTGILLVVAALLYFIYVVVSEGFTLAMGHRTPAFILIALLVSTGLQLFFFGFMLQLLNQIKRTLDRASFQASEARTAKPPARESVPAPARERSTETSRVA